jgi:hypothetical protein
MFALVASKIRKPSSPSIATMAKSDGLADSRLAVSMAPTPALVSYAAIETDVRGIDHQEHARKLYETFWGLSPDRFPLITAHAAQLVDGDADERFHIAVDVVIDGMLARTARS